MKIAILGAESSHANGFASRLAGKDGTRLFPDVELIGVYADKELKDTAAGVEAIRRNSTCEYFTDKFDEFVDKVDAVMITSRHGSRHLEYARPYLEKGIAVWIDKPITCSTADAAELAALAEKYHVPVCGGSSLVFSKEIKELASYVNESASIRGGHVTAPIHMNSEYDGFWFYAPHAVQMMLEVFGIEVRRVTAEKGEDFVKAVYEYDDFNVSVYFGTGYTVAVYGDNYHAKAMTVVPGSPDEELQEFYEAVKTGGSKVSSRAWIMPVFIIDATIRAYKQKATI